MNVQNEDLLLDFINELFANENDENGEKIAFYEQIDLNELSEEKLNEFISNIKADEMTNSLWKNISDFICTKNKLKTKDNEKHLIKDVTKIDFDYNENNRFKGIISFIGNGNPKNLVDEGVIDITNSKLWGDNKRYLPKNVVNYEDDNLWFDSANKPNSWLCINFKEKKIKPSYYSIKSNNGGGKNNAHLKNWVIEGSKDNVNWVILDERKNEESLNDRTASNTFKIQHNFENDEFYQYIKIRQTGLNTSNGNQLYFGSIEFFGSLLKT